MTYTIVDGNVYRSDSIVTFHVGPETYVETIRIDNNTVEDKTLRFNLSLGEYEIESSTTRSDPLPPPEPTIEDIQAATYLNTEFLVIMAEINM